MSQKEVSSVDYFTDSIVMPKASGKGVKVGEFSETSEDTADWGWRDITSQIVVRGTGPTDPSWSQIGSTAFWAYDFSINDQCWMAFHIPHDIVPNSEIFFHTHWLTDGVQARNVTWQYTYAYAKGFGQAAFDLGLAGSPMNDAGIITAQGAAAGAAYQRMVTETEGISIEGLSEPDGMVYVNIKRIANGSPGGADNTDGVFVLTSDIHYQSTNLGTSGKAPGFYD